MAKTDWTTMNNEHKEFFKDYATNYYALCDVIDVHANNVKEINKRISSIEKGETIPVKGSMDSTINELKEELDKENERFKLAKAKIPALTSYAMAIVSNELYDAYINRLDKKAIYRLELKKLMERLGVKVTESTLDFLYPLIGANRVSTSKRNRDKLGFNDYDIKSYSNILVSAIAYAMGYAKETK